MFATLSRAKDFDQLVRRFSGPTRIGDAPAEPRRRPLRSVAVRNRHRPTAAPLQRCAAFARELAVVMAERRADAGSSSLQRGNSGRDLDFDAAGSKVLWIQLEGSSSMDTLDRKAAAFHS